MPRSPKLHKEASTGRYMATIRGKKHRFTRNKRESEVMFHRLMVAASNPASRKAQMLAGTTTAGECMRRYVIHRKAQASLSEKTWKPELQVLREFESFLTEGTGKGAGRW